MSDLKREAWLLGRSRAALAALLLLFLCAGAGVALGLATVSRDRAAIDRMLAGQPAEESALAAFVDDAGYGAYYGFQPTWNPPSDLAFAALGNRDIAPTMLRIRALALEGQIYENEAANPELALPGRFDLAFVVVYLAPLVLIALLHDLWSGEREAGRLYALQATPAARRHIWGPRIVVRAGGVLAVLLVPFAVGAAITGTSPLRALAFAGIIVLACLFWTAVALLVARRGNSSAVNAASLAALWFALTLVAPAAAGLAINAGVTVPDGAALARENREDVHAGWDRPRDATMQRFLALYPQHAPGSALPPTFHWKWYFAFQHLGDLHVASASKAYRDGIARRADLARAAGWLLPPAGLSQAMARLARTDVAAQLAYQQRIRAYHTRLREFYYDYLFSEKPFGPADLATVPRFDPAGGM
ncbi:MAG: ABC transporter permease [Alphaproteobacteria bacterium]|nr:MAG: ABC transporter permease [Alphaproteobacteria bacterium]